jgi:hypothetical protein
MPNYFSLKKESSRQRKTAAGQAALRDAGEGRGPGKLRI